MADPRSATGRSRRGRRRWAIAVASAAVVLALTACTRSPVPPPATIGTPSAPPSASGRWSVEGSAQTLARDLDAPWSVVPLPAGGALISQRDDGRVLELTASGSMREIGVVPDVVSGGESGLNGLALWDGDGGTWLYAYHATATDNRVVRMALRGGPGGYALGEPQVILRGIDKAATHDGGRLAFGPDGMLYVTTGDAGEGDIAQDRDALNGKILRLTPEGAPAPGNPFGTAVWTYGHRNVQGIAWTADGTMWASEFGQDTWDELNVIVPGANYGWPVVEGKAGDARFRDPLVVWPTSQASPSGLAAVGDTLFLAALRGARIWQVQTEGDAVRGDPRAVLAGQGRLRDAVAAPDGSLWVLTNNTDGRGRPRDGDDLLLRVALAPQD